MRFLALSSLIFLGACGGVGLVTADDPNKASVSTEMVNGVLMVTGSAGSSFDESEIRNQIVGPECESAGMQITDLALTPSASGSLISATCG